MKFNLASIPKLCISLPRSTDRRESVSVEFARNGLHVDFIDGVDTSGMRLPELSTKTPGVWGAALAHVNAVRHAKDSGWKSVLIFEDDVIFCDDFQKRVDYIEGLDLDYDVFLLGGHYPQPNVDLEQLKTRWKHIHRVPAAGGSYAYILTEPAIDFYLRNWHYNWGADQFLSDAIHSRFKTIAFVPFMVGCRKCKSEVTGVVWEYENVRWYYQQGAVGI